MSRSILKRCDEEWAASAVVNKATLSESSDGARKQNLKVNLASQGDRAVLVQYDFIGNIVMFDFDRMRSCLSLTELVIDSRPGFVGEIRYERCFHYQLLTVF